MDSHQQGNLENIRNHNTETTNEVVEDMEHDLTEEGEQLAKEYFHEGFLGKDTRDHIGYLNTLHAPDIIFLSETKINDNMIIRLTNFLCMPNSVYVPSVGASGGLIFLWKDGFSVDIVGSISKMIHAIVSNDPSKGEWFLSCIYGTPYKTEQKEQWSYINDLSKSVTIPWVVLGDLNITMCTNDINHATSSITSPEILELIKDSDLTDLGLSGCPYTWTSNKHGIVKYKSRLDRAIINSHWSIDYPNAILTHLPQRGSDHTPILLELYKESLVKGRNWKFFKHWLKDENCHDEMKKSWDRESLEVLLKNHFMNIIKTSHPSNSADFLKYIHSCISEEDNEELEAIPSEQEIYNALMTMDPWKSPGPDVFPPGFYQTKWKIVKEDVCKTIKSFFHSVYKIISKVIALRTKKHISSIISPMQAAYVPRRLISENRLGFSSKFCQLISQCISTTEIEVLINGSPSTQFQPTRGKLQGDSLSPYLFILAIESFSRFLAHCEKHGELTRVINEFSICSGQLINFSKSVVYFSGNMDPFDCQDISGLFQVRQLDIKEEKYMGLPFFVGRNRKILFSVLIEKMDYKYSKWNASNMSEAARRVQQVAKCIHLKDVRSAEQAEDLGLWKAVEWDKEQKLYRVIFELEAKNKVADILSKLAKVDGVTNSWGINPPEVIKHQLDEDAKNVTL
ncbi:uncharacterized protein LOC113290979 [Papaver somniferum]|uniref:uncharacterized protein LOC113290979 n=1 Tax=Papaver somniferum TaxID=3469 RepID=UPI000E6FB622|nr:uncharacterized protein LOC113290979 [Papaver somniferum]